MHGGGQRAPGVAGPQQQPGRHQAGHLGGVQSDPDHVPVRGDVAGRQGRAQVDQPRQHGRPATTSRAGPPGRGGGSPRWSTVAAWAARQPRQPEPAEPTEPVESIEPAEPSEPNRPSQGPQKPQKPQKSYAAVQAPAPRPAPPRRAPRPAESRICHALHAGHAGAAVGRAADPIRGSASPTRGGVPPTPAGQRTQIHKSPPPTTPDAIGSGRGRAAPRRDESREARRPGKRSPLRARGGDRQWTFTCRPSEISQVGDRTSADQNHVEPQPTRPHRSDRHQTGTKPNLTHSGTD